MKRLVFFVFLISVQFSFSQDSTSSFKSGEFLKYKIRYGMLNAGFVTVELSTPNSEKDSLILSHGRGWTSGMVGFIFPVEDIYKSSFNPYNHQPSHFVRKINEGGYTKDKEITFDFDNQQALVTNHKKNTEGAFFIQKDVQDMLSSFYYMRNQDFSGLKENDEIEIMMFFDEEMNRINLKILGRELIKTNFGKVNTIKLMPLVQKGRVFKDEENVTVWITDDQNKIPVKIKASILVGSVKADLIEYQGLAHSFP